MNLTDLRVQHCLKGVKAKKDLPCEKQEATLSGAFVIDSCQRKLWIYDATVFEDRPTLSATDLYAGEEAYLLLLRVACGLESQVVGETDIFGQIKQAWKLSETLPENREALDPWMQRLFEDTKDIRSRHLQNIGGASYGSLVRKLIKDRSSRGPILIIGAGQIAQSVAPFLNDYELWAWNRSPAKLLDLDATVRSQGGKGIKPLALGEESRGWQNAAHVLMCIPASDPADLEDLARMELWKTVSANQPDSTLIHLGARRETSGAWAGLPGFHSLDDLFEMQQAQDALRSGLILKAVKACVERAKLRSLGASLAISHGWEDLAVFA